MNGGEFNRTLIGVAGHNQFGGSIGVGKDTVGAMIAYVAGGIIEKFSAGVWQALLAVDPFVGAGCRLSELVSAVGYDGAKRCPEVRRLMQSMSAATHAAIGETCWVDPLIKRIGGGSHGLPVVITDVRYPAYARWIRSVGGIVVEVRRTVPGIEASDDPSEAPLPAGLVDECYSNDRALSEVTPASVAEIVRFAESMRQARLERMGRR